MALARSPYLRAAAALLFVACTFPEIGFDDGTGASIATGASTSDGASSSDGGTTSQGAGGAGGHGGAGGRSGTGGHGGDGGGTGGGVPLTCVDLDEDGYLSDASDPGCDELPAYVGKDHDCDDDDEYTHPNQATFFTQPRTAGGWDYDCDGSIETQYLVECPSPCAPWLPVSPGEQGCGDTATMKKCNTLLGCASPPDGNSATQGCH